jgi:glycosyltransferase involved in cell wall biosynthesis
MGLSGFMIWIEGKNPALYKGGISQWLKTILVSLDPAKLEAITLVSPITATDDVYPEIRVNRLRLPWFAMFPRRLNHIIYNSFSFYMAARFKNPSVIFSPYFDVTSPKNIPTIYTIHDLCFIDISHLYSRNEVRYFLWIMKKSTERAHSIVTVSNATKDAICLTFSVDPNRVYVIPNSLNKEFKDYSPKSTEISTLRSQFGTSKSLVLYTGGAENRKNLPNLAYALEELISRGIDAHLLFTGDVSERWKNVFTSSSNIREKVTFLGHVSNSNLKALYLAADVVVYPSLSEGFGRACLEAMSVGVPLACSNLPSFREVAKDYAIFFNPNVPKEIADGIQQAIQLGRVDPVDTSKNIDFSDFDKFVEVLFELNLKGEKK